MAERGAEFGPSLSQLINGSCSSTTHTHTLHITAACTYGTYINKTPYMQNCANWSNLLDPKVQEPIQKKVYLEQPLISYLEQHVW